VKRLVKVEELLASPAYTEYWGYWWWKTLTGLTTNLRPKDGQGAKLLRGESGETFRNWLRDQMEANRPYDQFVYDLVSATGRTDENGATGFYARWEGKPNDLAGATAKTFLGLRIQCAQCHDHVFEKDWKQKDFQGMAAYFTTSFPRRVPSKDDPQGLKKGQYASVITDIEPRGGAGRGYAARVAKGKELPEEIKQRIELADVTPKTWMGAETKDVPGIPRRMVLARWITSKDNPYFAKAFVNRLWGHFMGRGIVNPVDDFGSFNTPSHPELLEMLAKDFADSGFDVKRLMRLLVNTETYQRSSKWEGSADPDPSLFARGPVRPMTTDQLYFSLTRASGLDLALDRRARIAGRQNKQVVFAGFSFIFDDDEMSETEDFHGSIPQGLFLMNSPFIDGALNAKIAPYFLPNAKKPAPKDLVRRLWFDAYGRPPEPAEVNSAIAFVGRSRDEKTGFQDLFWALLNSAEFMTNH
jgi:hypothetical protein